ncbi:MAG: energy transducer TonB [Bacteroidales bacterium]|nr:energy transducer TonB [Bacteroidales bacterium]
MKKIVMFVAALFLLAGGMAHAQEGPQNVGANYAMVDEKPMFQGGDAGKFSLWVFSQIKYPEEAFKNKVMGKTILQFTIAKDGKVKNTRILRGSGSKLLDDEALRVVSSSPEWTPGKDEGKPVDVIFTFPVVFKLVGDDKESDGAAEKYDGNGPVPYAKVEEKPSFMENDNGTNFTRWVFDNLKYPEEAKKNKIMGRVAIQLVISGTGKVKDVEVAKSSGSKLLDDEALRVVSASPDWKPGKIGGKAVDVKYIFPVVFMMK